MTNSSDESEDDHMIDSSDELDDDDMIDSSDEFEDDDTSAIFKVLFSSSPF